jgi:hypothetical protein
LADVGSNILTILVDVLEFLQSFDDVNVVPEKDEDVLGSGVKTVV